jgi:hypothetical protein
VIRDQKDLMASQQAHRTHIQCSAPFTCQPHPSVPHVGCYPPIWVCASPDSSNPPWLALIHPPQCLRPPSPIQSAEMTLCPPFSRHTPSCHLQTYPCTTAPASLAPTPPTTTSYQGANLIPLSVLPTNVTGAHLRRLLGDALAANMNMVGPRGGRGVLQRGMCSGRGVGCR